ncbi:unnamed protein product [Onchocerca flexuosa]|uniref:GIY-YIG domain-containing protein n=1 Tax=Onchocerca flexuosa TaxID=387005 RepID=A0A183HT58_9BILA|nr:unnamed protein product [Onchocerca flexuosa]
MFIIDSHKHQRNYECYSYIIISKDGTEQLLEHLIQYEADGPFEHNFDVWKMRLRTI